VVGQDWIFAAARSINVLIACMGEPERAGFRICRKEVLKPMGILVIPIVSRAPPLMPVLLNSYRVTIAHGRAGAEPRAGRSQPGEAEPDCRNDHEA